MDIELCPMPITTTPANDHITLVVADDHIDHHQNDTTRLASNDYYSHRHPLVTRNRAFWFFLSHVSFFCALGFFQKTRLYVSTFGNTTKEIIFFCVATLAHELLLEGLFFSSFFDVVFRRYRAHLAVKSLGEIAVMILASQLVQLVISDRHDHNQSRRLEEYLSSEVASLITCLLLTADALSVVTLLLPGYHYSVLEITAALTVHLGMESRDDLTALSWFVISVVFVILLVKNFIWHGSVNNVHG